MVAQSIVISEKDCGTKEGITITKETASGIETPFAKNVHGRVLAADVVDASGKTLFKRNHLLSKAEVKGLGGEGNQQGCRTITTYLQDASGNLYHVFGLDLGKTACGARRSSGNRRRSGYR